ncbi:MAG TPA: hypothetical protein PLZ19_05435 [Thermosynergistes sp.]|nr:hypothetical protein [Thermosynergistes sp.]
MNLEDLARRYGTPLYVYASDEVRCRIKVLKNAFGAIPRFHLMYAVKANNNVEILKLIASEGVRFDCANLNEAALAMKVGAPYMLSGIFYTREELEAALRLKATVNLDDPAAWDLVKELLSEGAPRPKRLFIRLNPGWGRGAFSRPGQRAFTAGHLHAAPVSSAPPCGGRKRRCERTIRSLIATMNAPSVPAIIPTRFVCHHRSFRAWRGPACARRNRCRASMT